jgi:ADP-heptose:LPS heptosyltransferase
LNAKSEKWLYFFNMLLSRMVNAGKRPSNINPQKILIIKWDELGDMITATHVFSMLRERFPLAQIDLITKPANLSLVQNDKNINSVFTDISDWKSRYDLHVELRGTWKSLLRTFRHLPGYRLDRGWVRFLQRGNQPHEIVTNYRIVAPVLGDIPMHKPYIALSADDVDYITKHLHKIGADNYIVYHTGARKALRRWPSAHFAALADFAITCLMKTPAIIEAESLSITQLAALISKARAFVGNESGPLQIADAVGIPSLSFFGPGVKGVFYPQHPQSRILHKILSCNPCDQVHCIHPENPCISRISVEEAEAALTEVLSNP